MTSLLSSSAASAEGAVATAPAGGGQAALSVAFDSSGDLRASVCRRGPCDIAKGERVELPQAAKARREHARLEPRHIGGGRKAIVVTIPDTDPTRSYAVVLAAPTSGTKPKVLHNGYTGFLEGIEGERSGPVVLLQGKGVYIGRQRENRDLCGRAAILAPQVLHHRTLELAPAKLMRLAAAERERAAQLTAERSEREGGASLLTAAWATSALRGHTPGALTDGKLETSWAEGRGAEGRGEFAVLLAPNELPIDAFEFVVRPTAGEPAQGTSPKQFWIATNEELFRVDVPEDAWQHPGASYEVRLEKPVQTSCVAVVFDSAYDEGANADVTLAEFGAKTRLSGASLDELVASLNGGSAQAEAAGAVLSRGGAKSFRAVLGAFERLDEGGRRVALDVLDSAPCKMAAPAYVSALVGPYPGQRRHAVKRIRDQDCRGAAADALLAALGRGSEAKRALVAHELAFIAPTEAVSALAGRFDKADADTRRAYRVALGVASRSADAREAFERALGDESLGIVAKIDLLRALGPRARRYRPAASRLFAELATPNASFRTRYLLLSVAAELARVDSSARGFLRRALVADPSPHIRAQAARVADDVREYKNELLRALRDRGVRVRHAAIGTLGAGKADYSGRAIAARLKEDPWPLVRAEAARALGQMSADPELDRALAAQLGDESPSVRRPVALALGARDALAHAELLRERLDDGDEEESVRAASAAALGMMCDVAAVGLLTEYARKLADPHASGSLRVIGRSALGALAALHPRDLAERLAPLRVEGVPSEVRLAAQTALRTRGKCGPSRARRRT